jgi:TPP-dependent pyruvate/acetoin dehydrogenase alpha subunit
MKEALAYSRKGSRPCMIIFNNLPRRFGHAATDRQFAYLTDEQIRAVAERSPVEHMCAQLVSLGVTTYPVLEKKYLELWEKVLLFM